VWRRQQNNLDGYKTVPVNHATSPVKNLKVTH
jgi:hypothetical protein